MNIQKLTIGQMATLNRVTAQALRYYDHKDLLKPYYIDSKTGYRYYHINQCARLDMIKYLQSTGATLDDIKLTLDDIENADSLLSMLKTRLHAVEADIEMALQKKRALKKIIDNYDKYKNMNFEESIFLEHQPARKIFSYQTAFNYFEQGTTGYEMMMSELRQLFYKKHLPLCYFCNVGTIMRKKYIEQKQFYSDEVFVFIDESFSEQMNLETLKENWYLCICSEDFNREETLARQLIAAAKQKNYHIIGDYLCEVILEFPDINEKPRNLYYKLQIPVGRS